jgi:hypothetical protein
MDTDAVRLPVADGANVTLMEQFAFTASVALLAGHVLVCAKSLAFVPVRVTLEMVSGAVPVLVRVTLCAALVVVMSWPAKVRLAGESETTGTTPVPVSGILCGLPEALSVTESEAFRAPVADGLKVTLIVQFAPAATLEPQVLVSVKSPLFAPPMAMPEPLMLNVAVPVFVSVTVWAALVVETSWFPKLRLVVPPKLTIGAVPVPVSETV